MRTRLNLMLGRIRAFFRTSADDRDLDQELETHLALLEQDHLQRGMTPEQARRTARLELGGLTQLRQAHRETRGLPLLENFLQDLRFATRLLTKSPGFSAVAILTLALGIGANTAIFTVVNALLVKSLPYKDPDRLVVLSTISQRYNSDRISVSYADILDWKAKTGLFEAVAALSERGFDVTSGDEPERIRGLAADREYFHVFTDPPLLGRTFQAEEDEPETNRVIVLSYAFWMRRFGGDGKVLGTNVELGGVPHTVIGVMPANSSPRQVEIFKPLEIGATPPQDLLRRDNHIFQTVARLRPGVALERAQAELTLMGTRIAREHESRAQTNLKVHPLREFLIGPDLSRMLWILLGAVFVVLQIACMNVANLLVARGAARQREVAIRNALGAGWSRLASQFLVESLVLALAGGLLGIGLGYAGSQALVRFAPEGVPRLDAVGIDFTVLAFAVGLCLLTAIVFGLLPVWNARRGTLSDFIREGGRGSSEGKRAGSVRSLLVVSELALAVVLLSAAGLLIRSFTLLQSVDPGLSTENMLTMRVALPESRYADSPQVVHAFQQILESVGRLPGVVSAAGTSGLPVGGGGFYLGRVFLTTGQPEPPASSDTPAQWSVIQPGYLKTMGIPLVSGRDFSDADTAESNPVILISQSMAQQMFPNQSPLGHRIRSWRDENVYREIVGVTGDVRYFGLSRDLGHNVYVPHAQDSWRMQVLVVRTAAEPRTLVGAVQSAIWSRDAKLAISDIKTMNEIVDADLARPRFATFLLGVFAATALAMSAIGIYGLMSYLVALQTREIGIRMALGAVQGDIRRKVTGRALLLAGVGVIFGTIGALGAAHLMEAMLFGVSATDAGTFAVASALLLVVAAVASYIPARRASRTDPLVALRYE